MHTIFLTAVVACLACACSPSGKLSGDSAAIASATTAPEKEIYVPRDAGTDDLDQPHLRYSLQRSMCSDNLVLLWEKGFGDDPATAVALEGNDMSCDPRYILDKTEEFYRYYRDTLGFMSEGSAADKYRMMIFLNYSLDATAYGGSTDDFIGSVWVTPFRLREPKLNIMAHELGHAFQYQLAKECGGGFSHGSTAYEMTSQWMLWQVNPDWMRDEEYHWHDFMRQTHLAFGHPDNMYHSPYVLEYWSNKYGKRIVGELWRAAKNYRDIGTVYMNMMHMEQPDFCDEMFDASRRFITYDMDRVRTYAAPYANRHECELVRQDDGWYGIAPERAPQQYGYNGIRLAPPEAGGTVRVEFQGNENMPYFAGWRYGFVGVRKDGSVIYPPQAVADNTEMPYSSVQRSIHGYASFTAPDDEQLVYLWLVVMAAPKLHLDGELGQFPYRFRVAGSSPMCSVR